MTEGQPDRWIEQMPLAALHPHPKNPRKHKPAELRKSFDRFGFTNPIIYDERSGLIAAGHGRYELLSAMKAEGAEPPEGVTIDEEGEWHVPVTRGWASANDDELMALIIADNRQAELGGWEMPELATMLTPMDLAGTGFTPKDLASMMEPAAAPIPTTGIENSYGQRADEYRNKQIRSIIFDYPIEDYEFVLGTAARARRAFGAETNAELFIEMLKEFDEGHPVTT